MEYQTLEGGGKRKLPYVYTEQGVAMLSSVLNSDVSIEMNIRIIRIFTSLRGFLASSKQILSRLDELEHRVGANDENLSILFETIKQFIQHPAQPRERIGFRRKDEVD